MANEIYKRIEIIIEEGFDGVASKFASKIGQAQPTISSMLKRQTDPSAKVICSILEHTKINPYWLLLGRGEMFTSNNETKTNVVCEDSACYGEGQSNQNKYSANIDSLESELASLKKEIAYLKEINSLLKKQQKQGR